MPPATQQHTPLANKRRLATFASCAACLFGAWLTLPGCEPIALVADSVVGEKHKAMHRPDEAQVALVLVDDPQSQFDAPLYRNLIATHFAAAMQNKQAVTQFVTLEQLNQYAKDKGKAFAATPVAQVGRDLGAQQVFHLIVRSHGVERGPGVYRPHCNIEVRLVDATASTRLWPTDTRDFTGQGAAPGYVVATDLDYKIDNIGMAGTPRAMTEALARQAGVDCSRLFYNWHETLDATQDEKNE